MMMAICRGAGTSLVNQAASSTASVTFQAPIDKLALLGRSLDLHDLGFLAGESFVDLLDHLVGQVLNLGGEGVVLVLADVSLLFHAFQVLHSVAADIAHSHPRLLGVFVGDLGELMTPL